MVIPKAFRNGAVMLILLMGSVVLLGSVLLSPTPAPSRDYSAFLADVKSGSVSKVVQQEQTLTVTRSGTPPETADLVERASKSTVQVECY